jgi:hypothetical protein
MLSTSTTGTVAALRVATVFLYTIIVLSEEKRIVVGTPLVNEQFGTNATANGPHLQFSSHADSHADPFFPLRRYTSAIP